MMLSGAEDRTGSGIDGFDVDLEASLRWEMNDGLLSFEDDGDDDTLSPVFISVKVCLDDDDFSTD